MESQLVNSMLTSVCVDFSLPECPSLQSPSALSDVSTSSGYSSSSEESEGARCSSASSFGRDILDLYSNLTRKQLWPYKATVLRHRDPNMFLTNRSVYHRCEGHMVEISGVENCRCCGFPVPVIL